MPLKYLSNVTTLILYAEKCIGCGKCEEVCPHGVFDLAGNKAEIIQKDMCMECGACAMNCPVNAIYVKAGVGCAAAIIMGQVTGKEPNCCCSDNECC